MHTEQGEPLGCIGLPSCRLTLEVGRTRIADSAAAGAFKCFDRKDLAIASNPREQVVRAIVRRCLLCLAP
jgi:hypothetical protein